MLRSAILWLFFFFPVLLFSNGTLKGIVTDSDTQDPLIGAVVSFNSGQGTVTGLEGDYEISVAAGEYLVKFSLVGFAPVESLVNIVEGETLQLNISMNIRDEIFEEVVISGSLYEKRASEEVISIEVIKPEFFEKNIISSLDDAARKVPGLNVVDGQANIRAGSGWAYGVGSRVGLVIDGQSALTPERQEIRWQFLPMESIGQIEVMKGASSVLYGSSAMNGTIHMQTIKPSFTPFTKFSAIYSIVAPPKRPETKWWRFPRMSYGANFVHTVKKSNQFEYLVSGAIYNYKLYYQDGEEQTARLNFSTRWTNPKDSLFYYGIKGNIAYTQESDFFFWQNDSAGALRPAEETNPEIFRVMIDPYMVKYDKRGNKHDIKTRFYQVVPEYDLKALAGNIDYQFSRAFVKRWNVIAGAGQQILHVFNGDFGGPKNGGIWSLYAQVDKRFDKLALTFGTRLEVFKFGDLVGMSYALDKRDENGDRQFVPFPLSRFGLNYQAGKNSFIRFNIGQAFRFPSFAERYADASAGGVQIYPNPDIIPEYGWNSELGYEQKFISNGSRYRGSFDLALFWQEYNDMIEFIFGAYPPDSLGPGENPLNYIGFKAINLSRARIGGYEVNLQNNLKISTNQSFNINIGYTYSLPIDLNYDTTNQFNKIGVYLKELFKSAGPSKNVDPVTIESMLRYRNRHLITFDMEYNWKGLSLGVDSRYYGYMEKVDEIFTLFIDGIARWRTNREALNMRGDLIMNARASYNTGKHTFGVQVNNILNREYMLRPGRLDSPLNFNLQYSIRI